MVLEQDLGFRFSKFLKFAGLVFFCFLIWLENGGVFGARKWGCFWGSKMGVFLGRFCPKKGGAPYSVHNMRLSSKVDFSMNRFW